MVEAPDFKPKRLTIHEYFEQTPRELIPPFISGQRVPHLPITYVELCEMIATERNQGCGAQPAIDDVVAFIGESENPDELVSQLPYHEEPEGLFISFVLPVSDNRS